MSAPSQTCRRPQLEIGLDLHEIERYRYFASRAGVDLSELARLLLELALDERESASVADELSTLERATKTLMGQCRGTWVWSATYSAATRPLRSRSRIVTLC